jgi:hypothetical protein
MDSQHPHAGATYRILEQPDGYEVEVSIPGTNPVVVKGFPSLERAQLWIETHQKQVEAGAQKRVPFRLRQTEPSKQR